MDRLKKILYRILSAFLIITMVSGEFAGLTLNTKAAEQTIEKQNEISAKKQESIANIEFPENNELFAGYAEQIFYGNDSISAFSVGDQSAGANLSGDEKIAYDALIPLIKEIAAGDRASAVIALGKSFTYEGADYNVDSEVTFTESSSEFDWSILLNALLLDCPYEMYWFDKTVESSAQMWSSGGTLLQVIFTFYVSKNYQGTDSTNVDNQYADLAKSSAEYAKSIVDENEEKSDYEKLLAYKEAICDLVTYDTDAVENGDFSIDNDPWQLIHVFDQDNSTNVVCEGYAKAFQYLCDITSFESDIYCYCVTGDMSSGGNSGGHMWNVVTIDNQNYLVDVTNCDNGTIGYPDKLFLCGNATGNITDGYTFLLDSSNVSFTYDQDTVSIWGDEVLKLSASDYIPDENAEPEIIAPSMELYKDENGNVAGVKITNNMSTESEKIWYGYFWDDEAEEKSLLSSATFTAGETKKIPFLDLLIPDREYAGKTFTFESYVGNTENLTEVSERAVIDYEITMKIQDYSGEDILVTVEIDENNEETYWIEEGALPEHLRIMYLTNSEENVATGAEGIYYFAPPWPVEGKTCWGASYTDAQISIEKLTLGEIIPSETSMKFLWSEVPKSKIVIEKENNVEDKATAVIQFENETQTLIYTGEPVVITAPVVEVSGEIIENATITYSYRISGSDDTYIFGLPFKVGTYEVLATLAEGENYNGAISNVLTLTIEELIDVEPEIGVPTTDDDNLKNNWATIDGHRYRFDKEGVAITGLFQIDRYYYYAESAETATDNSPIGSVVKGIKEIDGKIYGFHEEEYYRLSGWQVLDGEKYYFKSDCSAVTGWYQEGKNRYYADANGCMLKGEHTIDGRKYTFDEEYRLVTGWQTNGDDTYYLDDRGIPVTGMFQVEDAWYYGLAEPEGTIIKGLQQIEGKTYLFDRETGVRQSGWQTVDGHKFYFESDGIAKTGWIEDDGKKYYADSENNENIFAGALIKGPRKIDEMFYLFDDTENHMLTGWQTIEDKIYYLQSDGTAIAGWYQENNEWYYAGAEGYMLSGLQQINGETYYFDENCHLYTGWLEKEGKCYFFENVVGKPELCYAKVYETDESGWLIFDDGRKSYAAQDGVSLSGWQTIEENRYYFDKNGFVKTGLFQIGRYYYYAETAETATEDSPIGNIVKGAKEIDGKVYGFHEEEYYRLSGWQILEDEKFFFQSDCSAVIGWHQEGKDVYYADKNGRMVKGECEIDGRLYRFDEESHLIIGWLTNGEDIYYLDDNGKPMTGMFQVGKDWYYGEEQPEGFLAKGPRLIEGKTYLFDLETGVRLSGWQIAEGKKYYLNVDGEAVEGWYQDEQKWYYAGTDGHMLSGLQRINENLYYFDENCQLYSGWMEINGTPYYFENVIGKPELCHAQNYETDEKGWLTFEDGKRSYLAEDGNSLSDWQTIDEKRYYFDEYGFVKTGLFQIERYYYYAETAETATEDSPIGNVVRGIKVIDGKIYGFDENEYYRLSGWQNLGDNRYFFKNDCSAVTGWFEDAGYRYYANESGCMAIGGQIIEEKEYWFDEDYRLITGWQNKGEYSYYLDEFGNILTGMFQVEDAWYYGEEQPEGAIIKGLYRIADKTYLFDYENGIRQSGWQMINDQKCYFNSDGVLQTGWFKVEQEWYFAAESGGVVNGFVSLPYGEKIKEYYFDENYCLQTGWIEIDDRMYHFNNGKTPEECYAICSVESAKGWITFDGKKSYFNSLGKPVTGWQTISKNKYFFDENGVMQTGWFKAGNYWHYAKSNGIPVSGLVKLAYGRTTKQYYFDGNYRLVTGWKKINSKYYFFNTSSSPEKCYATYSGALKKGWISLAGGLRCYVNTKGKILTGWQTISGKRYYFNGKGILQTGWFSVSGKTYYGEKTGSVGAIAKGLKVIDGETYIFHNKNYYRLSGWQTLSGKRYYLGNNGAAVSGWQTIDGKVYYGEEKAQKGIYKGTIASGAKEINGKTYVFDNKSFQKLTGLQTVGGAKYFLDSEGVAQTGWFTVGTDLYYGEPITNGKIIRGTLASGAKVIDGKTYFFDTVDNYRVTGLQTAGGKKYYLGADGTAKTGWIVLDGQKYYAEPENIGSVLKGTFVGGAREIDGETYVFDTKSFQQLNGFQTANGNRYYLDTNGIAQTGWIEVNGKTYYGELLASGNVLKGTLAKGFKTVDGKKYYFHTANYNRLTGWQTISKKKYYFNADGVMQTGWFKVGSYWYYAKSNGTAVSGLVKLAYGSATKQYYFDGNYRLVTGWKKIGKKYYFFNTSSSPEKCYATYSGTMKKGWMTLSGGLRCYVNSKGKLLTGWQTIGGKKYYFNGKGVVQTGWFTVSGKTYYGEVKDQKGIYKGAVATGAKEISGKTYVFHNKNYYRLNGFQTVAGKKYYLDADGVAKTGWFTVGTDLYYGETATSGKTLRGMLASGAKEIDGKIYFFDTAKNYRVTGLQTSGGEFYYLNEEGIAQTGWFELNGGLCYGESKGTLAVGAKEIDGETYVFHDSNFTKQTGWQNANGNRYYLDSNGIAKTGWFTIAGKTYYAEPSTTSKILRGTLAKGFKTIGGKKYYFNSKDYSRMAGWQTISKKKYYFNADGVMQTGWFKVGSYWYYAKSNGIPISGLVKLAYGSTTKQYYFDGNYRLVTGWKKISKKYYFFNTSSSPEKCYATYSGSLKKGWMSLSGGLRCYVNSKGQLLTGWQTISGKRYYFNGKGVLQTGWFTVSGKTYYGEKTGSVGSVAKGLKVIDGETYIFHSKNYYRLSGWQTVSGKKYYLGNSGAAQTGWMVIDGKVYYGEELAQKGIYKGALASGAKEIGGETYVFHTKDFYQLNGYQSVNGKNYYLNEDGIARTGWFTIGTDLYYGEPQTNGTVLKGTLALGAKEIDGEVYFFDTIENYRTTGLQMSGGKKYYIKEDGTPITGWITLGDLRYYAEPQTSNGILKGTFVGGAKTIEGETYVFHESEFHSLTGFQSTNGKKYILDDTGVAQVGWLEWNNYWYYGKPTLTESGILKGTLANGLKEIEDKSYYFDGNCKIYKGWKKIGTTGYFFNVDDTAQNCYSIYNGTVKTGWVKLENGQKIYLNSKGNIVTGLQTISKKQYYFNSYGIMQTGWQTVNGKKYFFNYDGVYLPMSKPVISAITSTVYGTADIKWNTVTGVKDYTIEYSPKNTFPSGETNVAEVKDASSNSCRIESLIAGKTYYFRLKYTAWGSVSKDTDVAYSKYSDVKSMKIKGEVSPTATSATVKKCEIVEGNKDDGIVVHFEAKLSERLKSGDDQYYVVQTESYGTAIDTATPCVNVDKTFNVSTDFEINTKTNEALMNKYALAVKLSNGTYQIVSTPFGITNPETIAKNTTAIFKASSKKGLQGVAYASDGSMPVDARYANTKQTLLNLDIADVVNPKSNYTTFTYKGKTYKFSKCSDFVANIKSMNAGYEQYLYGNNGNTKVAVSLCLLLSYDSANSFLIDPSARSSGHRYYTLNVREEKARETLEALFVYLGELFGQEDCYVTNWILGNEINSSKAWNYQGSLSFDNYMTCYTTAFQMLYNAVKSEKTGNTVSISLDNGWTAAPDTYAGKTVLDSFAKKINTLNPNIEWSISYHPYSYPLTRADFWNDSSNTTNSTSTKYISMKNIIVLTNYAASLETKYKMDSGSIRVLLTEQGYSYGAGADKQATAIARGYYIAEFNNRIDAFIIRAIVDDAEEAKGKLYFGLMNSQQEKRTAFYVYEFMDSDLSKLQNTAASSVVSSANYSKFNSAKNILCNTNWKSIVPGFNVTKLAGIK